MGANDLQELIHNEKINYFRKWRADNKEKVKTHNENYWKRKAEKRLKQLSDDNQGGTIQ